MSERPPESNAQPALSGQASDRDRSIATTCARLLDSPIFGSVHCVLARLAVVPDGEHAVLLNRIAAERELRTAGDHLVRFVEPRALGKAFADQYEVRVYETGEVATRRHNWHDLFNALVWLTFPRTKACLNAHHYRELRAHFGAAVRGTRRDVLTLFDEGGIIVATSDPTVRERLRRHEWKALFWEDRDRLARTTRFHVFGHAILEKAIAPFAGVTAKALVLDVAESFPAGDQCAQLTIIDQAAAAYFEQPQALMSTRTLGPLPILGIPGWTAANDRECYYDDLRQFRPPPR